MERARSSHRVSLLSVAFLFFLTSFASAAPAPPATAGRIDGTVLTVGSIPLAGARVEAFLMMMTGGMMDSLHVETLTDAEGHYELAVPEAGCYSVVASAEGYVTEVYAGQDPSNAWCVEVAPGQFVEGVDFHLALAGRLSGRVTESQGGAPIAGARVIAMPSWPDTVGPMGSEPGGHTGGTDPWPGRGDHSAVTDENGEYTIADLPEDSYIVLAEAEGRVLEYYDNAPSPASATSVDVIAGQETTGIDFSLGRGGCITGIVTAESGGGPIEGAQVWAFPNISVDPRNGPGGGRRDDPNAPNGVTGPDGRYTLCGLPPGDVFVQVAAAGYLSEFYDNAARFEDADPVHVPDDGEVSGIDFALTRGGRIEGQIRDAETHAAVPGAWVVAWPSWADSTSPGGFPPRSLPPGPLPPGPFGGGVIADSTGHYVIDGLPSGPYIVLSEAAGFMPTYYPGTQDPSEATPVQVQAPDAVTGVDIELARGGSIAGTVVDQVTNQPIPGAWVELYLPMMGGGMDSTGTRPFPGPGAVTDSLGRYRMEGIASGSYIVFCSDWNFGYEPEFYKDARNPDEATPVIVKAPDTTAGIDFTLSRRGTQMGEIAGRITSDGDGTPIPGAVIFAMSLNGQAGFATSGNDGSYSVRGLDDGDYYVFAAATGKIGEFYNDALVWEDATPVALVGAASGIDFALGAQSNGPGVIEGRVTDPAGRGLSQVWIYAEPAANGARGFTTSGVDGRYRLAGLAAGSYTVRATRLGCESRYYGGVATKPDAPLVEVSAGAVRGVDIILPAGTDGLPGASILRVLGNQPNPFKRSTSILFTLDRPGASVTVDIFDVRGRRVRQLDTTAESAGTQAISWNGRDAAGRTAPAGVYLYRVSAAGKSASGRMLLVD